MIQSVSHFQTPLDLASELASSTEDATSLLDVVADGDTAVLDSVDRILNQGSSVGSLTDLSREELAETFKVLVELFDRGIVGYEFRKINGQPHKVFTDVAIGSDLHRAPLYRDGRLDSYI
ncbi:MAG: hypothetical protein CME19_12325 [Gemmatimonadetes bacterium]|nr:hypothetical protein [Gemmatimonadota bacterium]|tara:strand:- start:172 stop:531 length:360 start_codon:yes stop_codon:yes gene_type:complete